PASFSHAIPWSHDLRISSSVPSMRYSRGMPTFLPLRSASSEAAHSGTGLSRLVESFGSKPAIASSMIAQSSTERAIGPAWSSELAKATTPQREQRPYVGLMPEMPVNAAGWRIEPPVSVPVAAGHSRAATAAELPPDEPPGASAALPPSLRRQGLITLPKYEVSFDEPIANWSRLSLPSMPAPASHSFWLTVLSYCGTKPSRI